MKKVLSMALVLMMVLTLFAVPTMAATMMKENLFDPGFDSYAENFDMTSSHSYKLFTGSSATYNNADTKIVVQNGNKVLQIASTGTSGEVRSPKFDRVAGRTYNVSADVYIVEQYASNNAEQGYAAFSFSGANTSDKAATITWQPVVATAPGMDDITINVSSSGTAAFTNLPLNTWVHLSTTVTTNTDVVGGNFIVGIRTYAGNTGKTLGYVDNVSIKHQVIGAAVTKNVTGNGTITGIDDVVEYGTTADLTLTPAEGNFLRSLTVNGTDVTDSVVKSYDETLYKVYTYPITVNADTVIAAEFGAYAVTEVLNDNIDDVDYEIPLDGGETYWHRSSTGVITAEAETGRGNVMHITAGAARTPKKAYPLGLYKLSFDAKADTAGSTIRLQHALATSSSNATWDGMNRGAHTPTITTDWEHYEFWLEIRSYSSSATTEETLSTMNFEIGESTGYKIDNIVIEKYTETASDPVTPPAPTTAAVTITGANAVVSVAADTVAIGEGTTFTAKPAFGYYIASITIGGNAFAGFDAYKGGTYETGALAADTAIVVTTAAFADGGDATVSSEVATLPAVFAPAADSAVTFGKVLDNTSATSWGIELTKDGVGVTPYHGGSYLYKANATNGNGQYAIEFIGLEAGTYQIRSYMYIDGTPVFGAPTTFVVD